MAVSVDESANDRWKDLRRLTDRPSAFAHPQFEPGVQNLNSVHDCPVLVVGAGGLGCEILKNLALSGFKRLEVIDMDTIDLSNLNRQFLFRESDVGKSKAEVAARFIESRVSGCRVVAHNCRIQDKSADFYRRFSIVICGLDSINARTWLNNMMVSLVLFDEQGGPDTSTIIPMIDGGTEGFKGNARVILPYFTPCVCCTLDLYPPQLNFPLCTIAHTPRLPEHCVEYVKVILWEKEKPFGGDPLDTDNQEHLEWACKKATERADEFGIEGVDFRLTQGVLKRIIPAVASTNAVIAGSCVLEALKLASNISCTMNNYLNFADVEGAYFGVVSLERNPDCLVCSKAAVTYPISPTMKLNQFIEQLRKQYHLENPHVHSSDGMLYVISSLLPEMEKISAQNGTKTLPELNVREGGELVVSDTSMQGRSITLRIKYAEE